MPAERSRGDVGGAKLGGWRERGEEGRSERRERGLQYTQENRMSRYDLEMCRSGVIEIADIGHAGTHFAVFNGYVLRDRSSKAVALAEAAAPQRWRASRRALSQCSLEAAAGAAAHLEWRGKVGYATANPSRGHAEMFTVQ